MKKIIISVLLIVISMLCSCNNKKTEEDRKELYVRALYDGDVAGYEYIFKQRKFQINTDEMLIKEVCDDVVNTKEMYVQGKKKELVYKNTISQLDDSRELFVEERMDPYDVYNMYDNGEYVGQCYFLHDTNILIKYTNQEYIDATNGEQLTDEEKTKVADDFLKEHLSQEIYDEYEFKTIVGNTVWYMHYVHGYETRQRLFVELNPDGSIGYYYIYRPDKYISKNVFEELEKERLDELSQLLNEKIQEGDVSKLSDDWKDFVQIFVDGNGEVYLWTAAIMKDEIDTSREVHFYVKYNKGDE